MLASVLFEAGVTCLCGVLAAFIRFDEADASDWLTAQHGWLRILVAVGVVQGTFYFFDLYRLSMIRQRSVLVVRILQAVAVASVILVAIYFLLPQVEIGRGVFGLTVVLMLTMMACWRVVTMWLLRHPRLAERVLILGTGKSAVDLAREVLERKEGGYKIVGFVGEDPALVGKSLINPSVIGLYSELENLVQSHRVDRIVVAIDDRRGRLPLDALLRLRLPDEVAIVESVSFYESLSGKVNTDILRPSWLIFSQLSPSQRLYKHVRRLIDIVLATIGTILSVPICLATAVAIKLESSGPVFYVQERVGKHDKPFKIIKFRSMRTDAEAAGPVWAGESDSRVTRVGRLIRKLRIDELPQFVNVLRGEMSFIGPRPERPVFVEQLEQELPYYSQRHLVKPGLTGWAQVRYRYGASVEDARTKLEYDLYYIKNRSPMLDVLILIETVRMVLFGKGAR